MWQSRPRVVRNRGAGSVRECILLTVFSLVATSAWPGLGAISGDAAHIASGAPSTLLSWAEQSLERGAGPAGGHPESCLGSSSGSASCGPAAAPPPPTGNWTKGTGVRPGAQELSAMAYDPIDQYVVLFGGCGSVCSMNETWIFDNGTWSDITGHTLHTPPGRSSEVMAWDAADGYIVMFGGIDAGGFLQDTWEFESGVWANLLPAAHGRPVPPPRFGASMAYDTADGYLVLFGGGGFYQDRTLLNDTWSFVSGQWTPQHPVTSPSIRAYAAMDYDASLGKVLLFGGEENTIFSGDTWEYSDGNWTHLVLTKAPSPRQGATLVYDSAVSGSILFGGMGKFGFQND